MSKNEQRTKALYEALSVSKRANIAFDAIANQDEALLMFITDTIPRHTYRQKDVNYSRRVDQLFIASMILGMEWYRCYSRFLTMNSLFVAYFDTEKHDETLQALRIAASQWAAMEQVISELCVTMDINEASLIKLAGLPNAQAPELLIIQDEKQKHYEKLFNELGELAALAA